MSICICNCHDNQTIDLSGKNETILCCKKCIYMHVERIKTFEETLEARLRDLEYSMRGFEFEMANLKQVGYICNRWDIKNNDRITELEKIVSTFNNHKD